jgi:hypothetical protein
MGLVGAIGVTPTTFLMPAILWLFLSCRVTTSYNIFWLLHVLQVT